MVGTWVEEPRRLFIGDLVYCLRSRKLGVIPHDAKNWNFYKTGKSGRIFFPNIGWDVAWIDGTRGKSDEYWLVIIAASPLRGEAKEIEPLKVYKKTIQLYSRGVTEAIPKTEENMNFLRAARALP